MIERLDCTLAMGSAGDEAAGGGDFQPDVLDRIGRAGGHAAVGGVQHFQVIVAIADGEALRHRKAVMRGDPAQTAAFMNVAMAETEVDGISLPPEM